MVRYRPQLDSVSSLPNAFSHPFSTPFHPFLPSFFLSIPTYLTPLPYLRRFLKRSICRLTAHFKKLFEKLELLVKSQLFFAPKLLIHPHPALQRSN